MTKDIETLETSDKAAKGLDVQALTKTLVVESERDKKILEQGDADFKPFTWTDLQEIIESNELDRLSRKPSDLKHYFECKEKFKREYGGVLPFIIKEKLKWVPDSDGKIHPKNSEFLTAPEDVKIQYNDFPYGVEPQIVHVVVWSKASIPTAPPKGDLTDEARRKIETYIARTFCDYLGMTRKDVLWFKNWAALQSVRALEHFHVLLNNPQKDRLEQLIGSPGFVYE